jgi:hypothetical protein
MEATQKQVAEYLGQRIRRIRRGLDMSQENLADTPVSTGPRSRRSSGANNCRVSTP